MRGRDLFVNRRDLIFKSIFHVIYNERVLKRLLPVRSCRNFHILVEFIRLLLERVFKEKNSR